MKFRLLLNAVMLLCVMTASAGIEDIRIYINPGHGAFCSNCRAMGTVAHGDVNYSDTTGFYESNTNLQKGIGMFNKLVEYGLVYDKTKGARDLTNNIVMSRVASGDVHNGLYDRALSEIAAEAELNNFDMFISIHSNATTEGSTTNYPLFLYRGYDSSEGNAGSKAMAAACWPHWQKIPHMMWTHYTSSTNIRGDVSYMGSSYTTTHSNGKSYSGYYGVLRQGVPGFLVEGYFHTYQPARHKAMNWDACRWEGEAYARGVNDYFGIGYKESYGTIYGVLRDAETTFTHTYYTPNTNTLDKYLPINNATVTLKNSSGEVVQTYTTDDEYNGVFVFNKVTPGTYTLVYSHPDYKDATETVTVTANETIFPTPQISTSTEQIAVRGHYAYDLSSSQNGDIYTLKFKSTGAFENASIILTNTSTGATQSIATGAIVAGENSVTLDANSLGEDATFSWAVAIDNPKSTATELIYSNNNAYNNGSYYANGGVAIDLDQTSANFGKIYTSTGYGQGIQAFNPDFTTNGSKILGSSFNSSNGSSPYRIATSNGKVYITDWSDAHGGVWVYNPANGASVTNVFTGTNDGTGCIKNGSVVTGGGTTGVSFIGEGANRKMYVFCEDYPSGNAGNQLLRYDLGTADTWTAVPSQAFSTMSASTLFANTNVEVLATENGIFASQTRYTGSNTSGTPAFAVMDESGTVTFNSGSSLTTHDGCNSGAMALYNGNTMAIVNGAGNIVIYTLSWSGSTPSFAQQYTITISGTTVVNQMAFDHSGNLYVYSKQEGLLVYAIKNPARQTVTKANTTIQGVVEPAVQGHFAYNLAMSKNGSSYTLTFKSTGDVESASVVLTPITAGADAVTIALDAVKAGENTVTVDATTLAVGVQYNWSVALENPASPSVELVHSDNSIIYNNGTYDARIGVAVDNDVTSANFGTIYTITAMGQGLQKYNPDLTKNGSLAISGMFGADTDASTSANKYYRSNRLEIYDGKVYIANYANQNSGIWEYDPATESTPVCISGGTYYERAVAFHGEGSSRIAFSLHESNVQRFDIGTATSWVSGTPTKNYSTAGILDNGDGDLLVTDNAVIASQNRYSGNNLSSNPAFVVFDHDLNLVYKSDVLSATLNGSENGGMVLSDDKKTFVITNSYNNSGNTCVHVQVYDVAWSGSTPTFTHKYSIPVEGTYRIDQMAFDYAGNLLIASQQKGLLVYAIKTNARTTTTPAGSSLVIEGVAKPLYIVGAGDALGAWDPVNAVEFTFADGVYTIDLDETASEFKISTAKGTVSQDWDTFNAGNLAIDATITNGGTVNLSVNTNAGNIVLPWAGVWTITVAGDFSTLTATTDTPEPAPSYPEEIYAIGNVGGYNWSTSQGIALPHQAEGVYSAEITIDDAGSGNGYFQFATTLGENWDAVNAGTRYGALTKDEEIVVSVATAMTNDWGGSTQSWMIKSDTYIMVVDIVNCTVTVSPKTVGVEGIKADDNTPAVYYNLQGIEVANPENGVFIKKQGNIVTKEYVK